MTIQEILGRLGRFKKQGKGWIASCPCSLNHKNGDKNPSLKLDEGEKGILLNCFAGCSCEEICAALSISPADLFNHDNGTHQGPAGKSPSPASEAKSTDQKEKFAGTEADVERMRAGLNNSPECQRYISSRGISLQIATDLHWGFVPSWKFRGDDGQVIDKPALAIPHYVEGQLVGIKFRTIDHPKLFSQITGSTVSGLYGTRLLDPMAEEIHALEGPEDAALMMTHGYNVVAINSATSTKLDKHDVDLLCRHKRIYLIGDHDLSGIKAIDKLVEQLPPKPLIRIPRFGYKDVGDLWKADPRAFPEKLRRILRFARARRTHFELEDLLTPSELKLGAPEGRYAVDRLVPLNDVTMLYGEEKSGKSLLLAYWLTCVANHMSVFGKYQTMRMPAIILDLEASDKDIEGYMEHFKRLGPVELRYFTRTSGVPELDDPALIEICKLHHPIIGIESFTKFISREGNKSNDVFHPGDVSRFNDKVQNLCAAGATVIQTHHSTRGDGERYADSHQIGAAVARSYAVMSQDRPKLNRVRLEGKLARGAEAVSEDLIGFPVITETGHFGLADNSWTKSPIDRLVEFVQQIEKNGGSCTAEQIKSREGIGRNRSLKELNQAVAEGKLFWRKRGPVSSVRELPYGANSTLPYAEPRTDSTEEDA